MNTTNTAPTRGRRLRPVVWEDGGGNPASYPMEDLQVL